MPGAPVRDALDSAVVALTASGVETPRLDAEVLLAHVLGMDRLALLADRDTRVRAARCDMPPGNSASSPARLRRSSGKSK